MVENNYEELDSPSIFIGKQSDDMISLGSGQPDLPPPKEAFEGVSEDMLRKDLRYGLIQGEENLRKALAKKYNDAGVDDFVITNGASEALDLIFRALPSGKVLLTKPYYYSYPHILKHAGMTPVYTESVDGRIDINDFKSKVEANDIVAVLINSPSNPTGRVEDVDTLKEIEKITKENNIVLISDEVYKDLIYERENYELKGPHVVTINSFSKTYSLCGLRIGYLWSSDSILVKKCIDIKTHTSMNTSLIAQDMAISALNVPDGYAEIQRKIWKERRDYVYQRLINMKLDVWKPEGAFYVLPKIDNPKKFVWDMYTKHNVITYLGDWFGAPDRIRISYALNMDLLKVALDRIEEYLKE